MIAKVPQEVPVENAINELKMNTIKGMNAGEIRDLARSAT
jgi:hypothetical protein